MAGKGGEGPEVESSFFTAVVSDVWVRTGKSHHKNDARLDEVVVHLCDLTQVSTERKFQLGRVLIFPLTKVQDKFKRTLS